MQEMRNSKNSPDQIVGTDSPHGNIEMNTVEKTKPAARAPLYSSPWLAFFYVIRQGWGQPRS